MPKDTFLNLPEEKRAHIERVAMEEFAEHGYDNASINRIVEKAGIAKGSFYQYFEDKQDVLAHLMSTTLHAKLAYLSPVLHDPDAHDFYTIMREMWRSGLEFARAHPEAAQVANQFLQYKAHPVYKALYGQNMQVGKAYYRSLIERGIAQGDIRPDIHIDFVVHMLINVSVSMMEYYFEEIHGQAFDMSQIGDDVMDTVTLYLDFIQHGIASNSAGAKLGEEEGAQAHD
jgi:AcrR family transcriptional regulator